MIPFDDDEYAKLFDPKTTDEEKQEIRDKLDASILDRARVYADKTLIREILEPSGRGGTQHATNAIRIMFGLHKLYGDGSTGEPQAMGVEAEEVVIKLTKALKAQQETEAKKDEKDGRGDVK
jgi:hypothetical protein